jgi:hypothetical protein
LVGTGFRRDCRQIQQDRAVIACRQANVVMVIIATVTCCAVHGFPLSRELTVFRVQS